MLNYCKIPPAVNQIERHPYFAQFEMVKFCHQNNIVVTAYAPLGAPGLPRTNVPHLLDKEEVKAIAKAHGKLPAQVLIRWQLQQNVATIPKSVKPDRIKTNFQVFDFTLSGAEMHQLDSLDLNMRTFPQDWMGIPTYA